MRKIRHYFFALFNRDVLLKRFCLFSVVFLLSACTTVNNHHLAKKTHSDLASQSDGEAAAQQEENTSVSKQDNQENLPLIDLDSDLLYEILAADIAYKQGNYERGFEGMMDAADQTGDSRLAKRAAEMAVKEKNTHDVLDAVRLWHQLAPKSIEAKKYLIGFLVIEDRWNELQSFLSEWLENAPVNDQGPLLYQYQQFLSNSQDKEKAFEVLEEVAKPYLNVSETHVALSQMAFVNKDNERAEKEAKEALRLKPDSELAVLILAQAQADPDRSIQTLTAFLKKYPDSREVRISNARMLISKNRYKEARTEFEYILSAQPNDGMTLYSLGLLSIQQNDYAAAEKYLNRYLEMSKKTEQPEESYQAIFLLAQLAEEQKNYKKALKWLAKIPKDQDSEVWIIAQTRKAQVFMKQGRIKSARKNLAALRKEYPLEKERIILAEAQMLKTANLNKEAYAFLKSSIKNSNSISLLYDFSLAAEQIGRYDEMEAALRRILDIDPNNQLACNALGYSFADRNIRLEEAYVLIAKAMEQAPDDPYITDSMGWILFRQGKLKEAELMLRRAYELLPEAEVLSHLGEVLWLSGQHDEAKKFLLEAKEKDPKNKVFIDTIKRLGIRLR